MIATVGVIVGTTNFGSSSGLNVGGPFTITQLHYVLAAPTQTTSAIGAGATVPTSAAVATNQAGNPITSAPVTTGPSGGQTSAQASSTTPVPPTTVVESQPTGNNTCTAAKSGDFFSGSTVAYVHFLGKSFNSK
ncbi:unnamed protein product [Didymodactylos carnosus]|uniref:Uncharacterized protein n=1 Tax=Didymodactylos carnosus TaxID=1234261 RepID=A0A815EA19_9BILA|nr:unnamed protein product [Didymodactylos carnosus]CAF4144405.1 unnamed protein product [Didymodactylos carnosus]